MNAIKQFCITEEQRRTLLSIANRSREIVEEYSSITKTEEYIKATDPYQALLRLNISQLSNEYKILKAACSFVAESSALYIRARSIVEEGQELENKIANILAEIGVEGIFVYIGEGVVVEFSHSNFGEWPIRHATFHKSHISIGI